MFRFARSLFAQVVIALIIGVIAGLTVPDVAVQLKPLGDGFIKLIKMIIPVLVFCVVVHGIAGAGDLRRVGRVGVKALIYFELLTTVALALGLLLAWWFEPGVGMNVDPHALDASDMSAYAANADKLTSGGTVEFLLRLIPTTVVQAAVWLRSDHAGREGGDCDWLSRCLVTGALQNHGHHHQTGPLGCIGGNCVYGE